MWLLNAIFYILAFGAIAFLAYVASKYLGGKSKKVMSGKYISIIETVSLGLDKHIHLVKVEDQFVLIASTSKTIDFLTTLELKGFNENNSLTGNENGIFDFKSLLDKYVNAFKEKRSGKGSDKKNVYSSGDFTDSVKGSNVFKSNLGKLKDITGELYKKGKENGVDS